MWRLTKGVVSVRILAGSRMGASIKAKIIKKDGTVIDLGEICREEIKIPWYGRMFNLFKRRNK